MRQPSPMVQAAYRLKYALSKKCEHHKAALALHFTYYNFCRVHQTLKATPEMASGLSGQVGDMRELLAQN